MFKINFILTFSVLFGLITLNTVKSEDLIELKCFNESECKQFQISDILVQCIDGQCQCSNATGEHIKCRPTDRKLSNIIGGPCPCYQPNSECDKELDTCYCASDFMASSDKRRCLKKIAQMGEDCEEDIQCQRGDYNGLCDKASGKCYCMTLFVNNNGTCESITDKNTFCLNDTKCNEKFGQHSKCFLDTHHCVCMEGYITSMDTTTCLPLPKYLENCTQHIECITSMGPGAICQDHVCQCDIDYILAERKTPNDSLEANCLPKIKLGQYCRYANDCYQLSLNETEQSMDCIYGECICKHGFNSFNNGECVRGAGEGIKSKISNFVLVLFVLLNLN